MRKAPQGLLGRFAGKVDRFPLLLKFLDVEQMLSVQVHPRDDQTDLIPEGDTGKTEAWVVLEADSKSRIYAGLKPHTDAAALKALDNANVDDHLASFAPKVGEAVLIKAGTVHSLGDGVMVFEVQENSDTTFRLYDWNHVDPKTKKPRPLQVKEALESVNFDQGVIAPVSPHAEGQGRARVFDNEHFRLDRFDSETPFDVGMAGEPRVLVCTSGQGSIEHGKKSYHLKRGGVVVLPAALGPCSFTPTGPWRPASRLLKRTWLSTSIAC
jgi:mannose-6-phosphate isomerase